MEWSAYIASLPVANSSSLESGLTLSEEIHRAFSFICSLIMLILCCFGSAGNSISISIFTRRSMRSSINILLAGLSCVDLSILIISIVVFVVPGLNAYGHFGKLKVLQILIVRCFYQMGMVMQTCSVWTFVCISFERYLGVCFPLHVHRLVTPRRATFAQIGLLFFAIWFNFVRFWEYSFVYRQESINGSVSMWPIGYQKHLRDDPAYFIWYYAFLYIVVHFLIPFPLIALFNLHILQAISAARTVRYSLTKSKSDQRHQRQTNRMIVVVTAIFACCNVCPLLLNVWEAVMPSIFLATGEASGTQKVAAYFFLDISNLLVVLNSSINTIVYMVYFRQYRRICAKYCRYIFCTNRKRHTMEDGDIITEMEECQLHSRQASRVRLRSFNAK